jgi:hypothetical protein
MGPKNAGKGGGKGKPTAKGGSKGFNQQNKEDMYAALREEQAGEPCPRCNSNAHGVLIECWDKYKAQDHWTISRWNYETKAKKKKVEDFFQEQRQARIDDGGFKPKFKPLAPIPSTTTAAAGPATPTSLAPTQSSSIQASSQASPSKSAPPLPVQKRTPIETKDLGESLYVENTTQPGTKPDFPRDGVPKVATTRVGPAASGNELQIIANYVQVQQLPDTLHVYSLTFWRPSHDLRLRVELNKQREIKLVFEALMAADTLLLKSSDQSWATDFKDLWSTTAMSNKNGDTVEWDTPGVTCKLLDGKDYHGVFASVKYSGVLNNIRKRVREEDITAMSDDIRALNAYVARCIREHNSQTSRSITQLGANKFYVDDGYTVIEDRYHDSGLRAVRGYYMSIRPGTKGPLLNINVATTAFLKPCLVSEMLQLIRDPIYVERMLKGARVKIMYKRQEFGETKEQGYSMNDELPRTKLFQQFGEVAGTQKFFTMLTGCRYERPDARDIRQRHALCERWQARQVVQERQDDAR